MNKKLLKLPKCLFQKYHRIFVFPFSQMYIQYFHNFMGVDPEKIEYFNLLTDKMTVSRE